MEKDQKMISESQININGKIVKEKKKDQTVRIDVVLKSILRKMRKFYTHKFNDMSQYKNLKRYRDKQDFYVQTLLKFIKNLISEYIDT